MVGDHDAGDSRLDRPVCIVRVEHTLQQQGNLGVREQPLHVLPAQGRIETLLKT